MDILLGALTCVIILLFIIVIFVYFRLDKYRTRINMLWKLLEKQFDQWTDDTARIALSHSERPASRTILEFREVYNKSADIFDKIRSCNQMRDAYESDATLYSEGDQLENRSRLCESINFDLFYLNEAIHQLDQSLESKYIRSIAHLSKIPRYPPLQDFS